MYFLFGILVLISFVFVILFSRRKKKKILCRLACMNPCEKENLLNSLLVPLGRQSPCLNSDSLTPFT